MARWRYPWVAEDETMDMDSNDDSDGNDSRSDDDMDDDWWPGDAGDGRSGPQNFRPGPSWDPNQGDSHDQTPRDHDGVGECHPNGGGYRCFQGERSFSQSLSQAPPISHKSKLNKEKTSFAAPQSPASKVTNAAEYPNTNDRVTTETGNNLVIRTEKTNPLADLTCTGESQQDTHNAELVPCLNMAEAAGCHLIPSQIQCRHPKHQQHYPFSNTEHLQHETKRESPFQRIRNIGKVISDGFCGLRSKRSRKESSTSRSPMSQTAHKEGNASVARVKYPDHSDLACPTEAVLPNPHRDRALRARGISPSTKDR